MAATAASAPQGLGGQWFSAVAAAPHVLPFDHPATTPPLTHRSPNNDLPGRLRLGQCQLQGFFVSCDVLQCVREVWVS